MRIMRFAHWINKGSCRTSGNLSRQRRSSRSRRAGTRLKVFRPCLEGLGGRLARAVLPPAGLVSWYRAEGNANDFAGSNNGTLMNGATLTTGEVGQAFSLDGSNEFVEVSDS